MSVAPTPRTFEGWAKDTENGKWHLYTITTHRGYRMFYIDAKEIQPGDFTEYQTQVFVYLLNSIGWFEKGTTE